MEIGKYVDGRALNFSEANNQFDVAGAEVTPDEVIAYDRAGQVTWTSGDLRNWAYQYAANVGSGAVAAPPQKGWFTRLPTWGRILFVIVYPVSITYAIVVMWKDKRFSAPARVAITAVAAIFLLIVMGSANNRGSLTPSATAPEPTKSVPAAQETAPQSSTPAAAEATPPTPASQPAPAPKPTPPAPAAATVDYPPGMYKVGTDLPPGEYALVAEDSSCYFQVTKDSSGSFESIVCNDNFANRSIITVKSGQYITVTGARVVPFKQAAKPQVVDGLLPEGMYKAGRDFPAGEYKAIADGSGYIEVAKNSLHNLESIISNDNFEGERYIKVATGQYLKLNSASLKMK